MKNRCQFCKNKTCICLSLKDGIVTTNSSTQLLMQVDLNVCPINRNGNDVNSMLTGGSTFVVVADAQDFNCKVKENGSILVTPLLDDRFSKTNPFGLGPTSANGPFNNPLNRGYTSDHLKFFALTPFQVAPNDGNDLFSYWDISAKQSNVECNPFDGAVVNPNDDPRLAAVTAIITDPITSVGFGWFGTNEIWYASISRLPGLESNFGLYASYVYLIPLLKRNIVEGKDPLCEFHKLKINYNRLNRSVIWSADNKLLLKITNIGVNLNDNNTFIYENNNWISLKDPKRFKVIDHGGVDNQITPDGFSSGIGLFTLLDAYLPNNLKGVQNLGLVRLDGRIYRTDDEGNSTYFYNDPITGGPAKFLYDCEQQPLRVGGGGQSGEDEENVDEGNGGEENDDEENENEPYNPYDQMSVNIIGTSTCIPPNIRIFGQGSSLILRNFFIANYNPDTTNNSLNNPNIEQTFIATPCTPTGCLSFTPSMIQAENLIIQSDPNSGCINNTCFKLAKNSKHCHKNHKTHKSHKK